MLRNRMPDMTASEFFSFIIEVIIPVCGLAIGLLFCSILKYAGLFFLLISGLRFLFPDMTVTLYAGQENILDQWYVPGFILSITMILLGLVIYLILGRIVDRS